MASSVARVYATGALVFASGQQIYDKYHQLQDNNIYDDDDFYAEKQRELQLAECEPGFGYKNELSIECTSCPHGRFSIGGPGACVACPSDKSVTLSTGSTSADDCLQPCELGQGYFEVGATASVWDDAVQNYTEKVVDALSCGQCDVGSHSHPTFAKCVNCDYGQTTEKVGAGVSIESCRCLPGYWRIDPESIKPHTIDPSFFWQNFYFH